LDGRHVEQIRAAAAAAAVENKGVPTLGPKCIGISHEVDKYASIMFQRAALQGDLTETAMRLIRPEGACRSPDGCYKNVGTFEADLMLWLDGAPPQMAIVLGWFNDTRGDLIKERRSENFPLAKVAGNESMTLPIVEELLADMVGPRTIRFHEFGTELTLTPSGSQCKEKLSRDAVKSIMTEEYTTQGAGGIGLPNIMMRFGFVDDPSCCKRRMEQLWQSFKWQGLIIDNEEHIDRLYKWYSDQHAVMESVAEERLRKAPDVTGDWSILDYIAGVLGGSANVRAPWAPPFHMRQADDLQHQLDTNCTNTGVLERSVMVRPTDNMQLTLETLSSSLDELLSTLDAGKVSGYKPQLYTKDAIISMLRSVSKTTSIVGGKRVGPGTTLMTKAVSIYTDRRKEHGTRGRGVKGFF